MYCIHYEYEDFRPQERRNKFNFRFEKGYFCYAELATFHTPFVLPSTQRIFDPRIYGDQLFYDRYESFFIGQQI